MKLRVFGHKWALEVIDAVMKRTGGLLCCCRLESDACCSKRLREKLRGREGDGGGFEEGAVECGLQQGQASVEGVVAALVNGPGSKLRRIGDFLKGQQVTQTLKNRRRAKALHTLKNNDEVCQTGTQFGILDDLKEALAANSEEKVVVAYFAVVLKGQ